MTSAMLKLIQITDCHLQPNPELKLKKVNPLQTLTCVVKNIQRRHRDANALLLTGDISHDGSVASYQLLADLLQTQTIPAYLIPGNHDQMSNLRTMQSKTIHVEFEFISDYWQLIMLDSTIEGKASGSISAEEMQRLTIALSKPKAPMQLIALHHQPLDSGFGWLDNIGTDNGDALLKELRGFPNAKIIIHGHTHQARHYQWQHLDCYSTPSSWRQFTAQSELKLMDTLPPAYRVLALAADGKHRSWVEFVTS